MLLFRFSVRYSVCVWTGIRPEGKTEKIQIWREKQCGHHTYESLFFSFFFYPVGRNNLSISNNCVLYLPSSENRHGETSGHHWQGTRCECKFAVWLNEILCITSLLELFLPPNSAVGHLTGWLEGRTSWTAAQISWQNVTRVSPSAQLHFISPLPWQLVHIHRLQLQTCPRRRKDVLPSVLHILQSIRWD